METGPSGFPVEADGSIQYGRANLGARAENSGQLRSFLYRLRIDGSEIRHPSGENSDESKEFVAGRSNPVSGIP